DGFVELAAEEVLVDVVLILADADGLGIDFDELGEWVLEPPANACGASDGEVEVRKLLFCNLTGRVDRRTRFADHDDDGLPVVPGDHFFDKLFCFATSGTVADGDELDV